MTRVADVDQVGIIESVATGDEFAFGRIVAAHHGEMLRVCVFVCGDRQIAEDAVQAAWSVAWRKLDSLRDPGRLAPWLVSIAVNQAKDLSRGRHRRSRVEAPSTSPWNPEASTPPPGSMPWTCERPWLGSSPTIGPCWPCVTWPASTPRIVALFGGVMLTSVGLVPQGEEPIPAAVEDAEGGLVGATHVTGTYVAGWTTKRGSDSETDARWGTYDAFLERHWEWSDPRLPQKMLLAESWDFFPVGSADISGAISLTQNVRLEGPDGAWTGTAHGLIEEAMTIGSWTYPQTVLMVLEGERAHEGLSAMLATTYDEPPVVNEVPGWAGYIFEGGMTPLPEAPEPPSAE